MKEALALECGPGANGASSRLARSFAEGFREGGGKADILALRNYAWSGCTGCQACAEPPHLCRLSKNAGDEAGKLFSRLAAADLLVWASPIYFYSLPAHFKALIDRAQQFWYSGAPGAQRPSLVILTAGRSGGEKLFEGALLTFRYFLRALGSYIASSLLVRGLDEAGFSLAEYEKECRKLGAQWAARPDEAWGAGP